MFIKNKKIIPLILTAYIGALNAQTGSEQVTWVQKPPANIAPQQSVSLSWSVKNFDGDFHAVCTFCPESLGPNCPSSSDRQQTQIYNGTNSGTFQTQYTLQDGTPAGNYYVTAYGLYSRKQHYNAEPILISYGKPNTTQNSSSNATNAQASSSSTQQTQPSSSSQVVVVEQEPSSSTTVVVEPVPGGWWSGWGWGYNNAESAYNQHEENVDTAYNQHQDNVSSAESQHQQNVNSAQTQHQDNVNSAQTQHQSNQDSRQETASSHQQGASQRSGEGHSG
ncbi:MAG: hypothetical protein FJ161_04840, partial [Gammaproteobacteria bacterium]|nr:hypothetical protein [Gammaproteobacteria bacterium]